MCSLITMTRNTIITQITMLATITIWGVSMERQAITATRMNIMSISLITITLLTTMKGKSTTTRNQLGIMNTLISTTETISSSETVMKDESNQISKRVLVYC